MEIIGPAVKGTTSILHSVLKNGFKVKRFVQISSISAVQDLHAVGKAVVYTEKNWGDRVVRICKEKGREASGIDKYEASKVLSERAAWEFVEEHKDTVKFDLVSINPALILGPALQEAKSPQELNTSLQIFYFAVVMGAFKGEELTAPL